MLSPTIDRGAIRTEASAPLPFWPIAMMVAWYPLWFILGLSGVMWVVLSLPMAASLARRRGLVLPKGAGWWMIFLVAVIGSVTSLDAFTRFIGAWLQPSFAQVQDIIGVPVPRPKAPFTYTNEWGSMLALLTPFGFVALYDRRVGFSVKLIRIMMALSVIPAVISLNRGLWLSLGLGVIYAAIRFGVAGEKKLMIQGLWGMVVLVVVLSITPLGGLIATRINTGHSNEDRAGLAVSAIEGAIERPVFGWGAPRPNERNLPSVGTHGQLWFVTFSHGFLGAVGFVGTMLSLAWHTRRQTSTAGLWVHVVIMTDGCGVVAVGVYERRQRQCSAVDDRPAGRCSADDRSTNHRSTDHHSSDHRSANDRSTHH